MLRLFSSSVSALALLSTAAFAADLPLPVEPIPAAPLVGYDWTGFYVGLSGGYGWGDYDYDFDPPNVGDDLDGWVAGGQAGYNWQSGMFVFGGVADISWANLEGEADCPNPAFTCDAEVQWLGTVRGNLGVAFDRFLVYGSGGFAYGGMERESVNTGTGDKLSQDEVHIGWTGGGGAAFAATNNLTIGAEALWVDLGDESYSGDTVGASTFSPVDIGSQFVILRGNVNFKF